MSEGMFSKLVAFGGLNLTYRKWACVGITVILLAIAVCRVCYAFADGSEPRKESCSGGTSCRGDEDRGDKERILPGEEISVNDGKKLKVWTTEGPIPVGRAPEPFREPSPEFRPGSVDIQVKGAREHNNRDERR